MNVRIDVKNYEDSNYSDLTLSVDGEMIGTGCFGGEPEDNTKCRTYHWVVPLLKKLAIELGGAVQVFEKTVSGDDDE